MRRAVMQVTVITPDGSSEGTLMSDDSIRVGGKMFNVDDIHDEISDTKDNARADNPTYEVVAVHNHGQGIDEQRIPIEKIEWDHDGKEMLLVLD